MDEIAIHTLECTQVISKDEYEELKKYLYSTKKSFYPKSNELRYDGFVNKGIRITLKQFKVKDRICDNYQLQYIINPARYNNNNAYLQLTKIKELHAILNEIGEYLSGKFYLLSRPIECKLTRIDFTKNIYVGENISYIIQLLNRCYKPYNYEKNFKNKDNNATFTKYNSKRQKLCELSFYDKFKEMKSHIDNHNYQYNEEMLNLAQGILRMEFRFYTPRLKNMKKSYPYKTVSDFFEIIDFNIEKIIEKNLKSLYLDGDFYKLNTIFDMVDFSPYKDKTKKKMRNFIKYAAKHKNSDIAAIGFADKYGDKELRNILKKFNKLGIIPTPISVRQLFDEWSFRE